MQGPRLQGLGGGLLMVWADASMEGRTWLTSSDDGGGTFTDPEVLSGPSGDLGFAQAESGGGVRLVGGSGADGTAWVYRPQ